MKLLYILILMLAICLPVTAVTSVQFLLTDPQYGISQTTNATVTVQAEHISLSGPVTLLPLTLQQVTDATGQTTFTNIYGSSVSGFYHWTINPYQTSQTIQGDMWVQSTNLGTIQETIIDIVNGAPTYPAGTWCWSAQAADIRYQLSGINQTNWFYPLNGNPSNYVQNATLLTASNAITLLIPSTNGFVTQNQINSSIATVTNAYGNIVLSNASAFVTQQQLANATNGAGNTNYIAANYVNLPSFNSATSSIVALSTTISNATALIATTGSNALQLAKQPGSTTLTNLSGVVTNQIAFTNSPYFDATGTALNSTNGMNTGTGIMAFVPTNGYGTLGYIQGVSNVLNSQIGSASNVVANLASSGSNTLQFAKQPASTILSNAAVTGINTNIYIAGVGAYLTTNVSGNVQSLNVSNQTWLTNNYTATAAAPVGSLLSSNNLPLLTNGFVGLPAITTAIFNGTNGLAGTNAVTAATNGITSVAYLPPGYLTPTNGNFSGTVTNANLNGAYASIAVSVANTFNTTLLKSNNYNGTFSGYYTGSLSGGTNLNGATGIVGIIPSNNLPAFLAGTDFVNQAVQAGTNGGQVVLTNYTGFVGSTNGIATSLNLLGSLVMGNKTNWLYNTNDVGIGGACGAPGITGTYRNGGGQNLWTNYFNTNATMAQTGPSTFLLITNGIVVYSCFDSTLYSWQVVAPNTGPAPIGHWGSDDDMTGRWLGGHVASTNITDQINKALSGVTVSANTNFNLGGYIVGPTTNNTVSVTFSNYILQIVTANEAATTNVSAQFVTNVANLFSLNATNGMGLQSASFAFVLTNGYPTLQFVTNYIAYTSNYLNSLGNGTVTNGLAGTNWVGANFLQFIAYQAYTNSIGQQSKLMAYQQTNAFIGSTNGVGYLTALTNSIYVSTTNLFVKSNAFFNNQQLEIDLTGANLNQIPLMTASNAPSGNVTASTSDGVNLPYFAFAASGDWDPIVGDSASWIQYSFASAVTVNNTYIQSIYCSGNAYTATNYLAVSQDGVSFTPAYTPKVTVNTFPSGIAFSNTFGAVSAKYFRWYFSCNTNGGVGFAIGGIQLSLVPVNNASNSVSGELSITATNGVGINTTLTGENALEVNGNVDSTVGYTINGVPIGGVLPNSSGLNYLSSTNLVATGGTGFSTNFDGTYLPTGLGYWTNVLNGYIITLPQSQGGFSSPAFSAGLGATSSYMVTNISIITNWVANPVFATDGSICIGYAGSVGQFRYPNNYNTLGPVVGYSQTVFTNLVQGANAAIGVVTNEAFAQAFTNGTYIVGGIQYQTNIYSVIQACIDRLPISGSLYMPSGGAIELQAGIYQLTNGILYSNNFVGGLTMEGQGMGQTIIQANGNYTALKVTGPSTNDSPHIINLKNLGLVNTTVTTNYLIYADHWGSATVERCLLADWYNLTNNWASGNPIGMQVGIGFALRPTGLVGAYLPACQGDGFLFDKCQFDGLGVGIVDGCDHLETRSCQFQAIDMFHLNGSTLVTTNTWPNTSPLSIGAALETIPGPAQDDCKMENPYFFWCHAPIYDGTGAGVTPKIYSPIWEGSAYDAVGDYNAGTTIYFMGYIDSMGNNTCTVTNIAGVYSINNAYFTVAWAFTGGNGFDYFTTLTLDNTYDIAFGVDTAGNVTATSYTGPGTGLTSIPAGNLTGTAPQSVMPFSLIQTNFIGGKLYANTYGATIQVTAGTANTLAAVSGDSELGLWVVASPAVGGTTNYATFSTSASTVSLTMTNTITAFVPTNAIYGFTNLSTGAGDVAVPVGGQIMVY